MANRPEPLVRRLALRPGQKEERWVQLLTPAAPTDSHDRPDGATGTDRLPELESTVTDMEEAGDDELGEPRGSALRSLADEVNVLRAEVAALRAVVEQLQTDESCAASSCRADPGPSLPLGVRGRRPPG